MLLALLCRSAWLGVVAADPGSALAGILGRVSDRTGLGTECETRDDGRCLLPVATGLVVQVDVLKGADGSAVAEMTRAPPSSECDEGDEMDGIDDEVGEKEVTDIAGGSIPICSAAGASAVGAAALVTQAEAVAGVGAVAMVDDDVGAVFSLSSSFTAGCSCLVDAAASSAAFLFSALRCLRSLFSRPLSQWMAMGSVKGLEADRRRLLAGDGVLALTLAVWPALGCGCCCCCCCCCSARFGWVRASRSNVDSMRQLTVAVSSESSSDMCWRSTGGR